MTTTANGYRFTWAGDVLHVHDVEIFCECERGDLTFDDDWIESAVKLAKDQQKGNYLPPLHIRHHKRGRDEEDVRAAGMFQITGTRRISYRGDRKLAILADLIITDKQAQQDVLAMKYPYRSVEIMDVSASPEIDSLALLDHEAPFLQLPMLMIHNGGAVHHEKSWSMDHADDAMVACFRKGSSAHLLMQAADLTPETAMSDTATEPEEGTKPEQQALFMQEPPQAHAEQASPPAAPQEKAPEKPDDADSEPDTPPPDPTDVQAVVGAIQSGAISIADMDKILAAIQSQQSAAAQPEVAAEPPQPQAPAATPGAETMSKETSESGMDEQMAELAGKNRALETRLTELEAERTRDKDVAVAMERFANRPMGSIEELEQDFVAFHKENGPKAFAKYVDGIAKNIGVMPEKNDGDGGDLTSYSELALSFQDKGTDAVDMAARFEKDWEELRGSGLTVDLKSYVTREMARVGQES